MSCLDPGDPPAPRAPSRVLGGTGLRPTRRLLSTGARHLRVQCPFHHDRPPDPRLLAVLESVHNHSVLAPSPDEGSATKTYFTWVPSHTSKGGESQWGPPLSNNFYKIRDDTIFCPGNWVPRTQGRRTPVSETTGPDSEEDAFLVIAPPDTRKTDSRLGSVGTWLGRRRGRTSQESRFDTGGTVRGERGRWRTRSEVPSVVARFWTCPLKFESGRTQVEPRTEQGPTVDGGTTGGVVRCTPTFLHRRPFQNQVYSEYYAVSRFTHFCKASLLLKYLSLPIGNTILTKRSRTTNTVVVERQELLQTEELICLQSTQLTLIHAWSLQPSYKLRARGQ